MFQGFIDEGLAASILFLVTTSAKAPVEPDAAPTWRLYGVNGLVAAGTGTASSFETGVITGATFASPITFTTSAAHGLSVGQVVTISGVGGNTAANGTFAVASVPSNNTFTVTQAGNGNYTSGGVFRTTGLYRATMSGSVLSSLEAGKTYTLVINWLESTARRALILTFTVR
jgi:hypothetical protein